MSSVVHLPHHRIYSPLVGSMLGVCEELGKQPLS